MFDKQDVLRHQYLGEGTFKQDKSFQSANINLSPVAECHRTGVILWSGKRRQAVFQECSALSVNHNFSLL